MSKFFRLRRNEGYIACGDAVPPRPPKNTDTSACLYSDNNYACEITRDLL